MARAKKSQKKPKSRKSVLKQLKRLAINNEILLKLSIN